MSVLRWMCSEPGCREVLAHITLDVEVQVRGTIVGLTIECHTCHRLNDIARPTLRPFRQSVLTERDRDSMLVAMVT